MRLLLLLEPGFALLLVALISCHLAEPTARTSIGIASVLVVALLPLAAALRRREPLVD